MSGEDSILLVEDNPDDELLAVRALKKNNIDNKLIIKRDGVEALDYLLARGEFNTEPKPELPRVIFLDLKLPRVGGFEVLQQIRANQRTKFIPVVILTSSKEQEDLIKGYSLGANSYVRKPVDYTAFVDAVKHLGLYWLDLNEGVPHSA